MNTIAIWYGIDTNVLIWVQFGDIVSYILTSSFLVDVKLFLSDSMEEPVKSHVH